MSQPPRLENPMADIVNLRRARKKKARADAEKKAVQNRAAYGQSKLQKASAHAERDRATRTLDGAKRCDDSEND